jgi:hypothetical protein
MSSSMTTQPPFENLRLSSVPKEVRKVSRQPVKTVSSIHPDKSELSDILVFER